MRDVAGVGTGAGFGVGKRGAGGRVREGREPRVTDIVAYLQYIIMC